jgi:hypothetical protein
MPTMPTTWTITSSVSPASTQSISWVTLRRGSISAVGPYPGETPFQVLPVIHGKVYAGSQDRLVVFARARCYPVQDSSVVVFLCPRIPAQRILQKKLARKWITVTDPASRVDKDVIYLFDHPRKDVATYRVCFKDLPKNCLPEVTVKINSGRCRGAAGSRSPCLFPGKPPWSLPRPADDKTNNDVSPAPKQGTPARKQ